MTVMGRFSEARRQMNDAFINADITDLKEKKSVIKELTGESKPILSNMTIKDMQIVTEHLEKTLK